MYKSKLNHHLENGVGSNLKARLSSDLQVGHMTVTTVTTDTTVTAVTAFTTDTTVTAVTTNVPQLNMETQQKDMMDRMTALLPIEKQTVSRLCRKILQCSNCM